jgi:superfamily II DNA or RNA helicase
MVSKERFNELQEKSNEIRRQGYQFVNLSHDQIVENPREAIYELRRDFISDPELYSIFLNRNKDKIQPHEVQTLALEELDRTRKLGNSRGVVVLAKGLGKTYLSIFDTLQLKAKKILFIVHVGQVLKDARNSFEKVVPSRIEEMGYFQAGQKEVNKDILFATIQTLSRDDNLKMFEPEDFDYIILDETHHSAAPTYRKIINYFNPVFFLGLTATPNRMDQQDILKFYENNLVFKMDQKEAIKKGYLAGIDYYGYQDNVDYSNIRYNGFRYDVSDLNKLLMIKKRDEAVLEKYKEKALNKKTIGFCASTQHADWCAQMFNDNGISSIAIHSNLDSSDSPYSNKDRDTLVQDFANNKYEVAFVVDMFNEGVDFPEVDCILLLRPTESTTILTQQIGRGLRVAPGKKSALILDFIGNYKTAYKILPALGIKITDLKKDEEKGLYYYDNDGRSVTLTEDVVKTFRITTSLATKDVRKDALKDEWIEYGNFIDETTQSGSKLYWKVGNKNNHIEPHLWALDYINSIDTEEIPSKEISRYIKIESRKLFPGKTMEGIRALFFSKLLGLLYSDSPPETSPVFDLIKEKGEINQLNKEQAEIISNQLEKFFFWNDTFSLVDRHTEKDERTPINKYFHLYPLFFLYELMLVLKDNFGYEEGELTRFEVDFFASLARTHNEVNSVSERIVSYREDPEIYEIRKYLRKKSHMDARFFKTLKYCKYFNYSKKKIKLRKEYEQEIRNKVNNFKQLLESNSLITFNEENPEKYRDLLYSTEDIITYHNLL